MLCFTLGRARSRRTLAFGPLSHVNRLIGPLGPEQGAFISRKVGPSLEATAHFFQDPTTSSAFHLLFNTSHLLGHERTSNHLQLVNLPDSQPYPGSSASAIEPTVPLPACQASLTRVVKDRRQDTNHCKQIDQATLTAPTNFRHAYKISSPQISSKTLHGMSARLPHSSNFTWHALLEIRFSKAFM